MDDEPRRGELTIEPIDGARFMALLGNASESKETGGRIASQYEEKLRCGDPTVGAFGFSACGKLVGGLSWATIALPRFPGAVSSRLDTVVTLPSVRGRGIGAVLMSEFLCRSVDSFQENLRHLSTVALHPAVGATVSSHGFSRVEAGEVPLYQLNVEDDRTRLRVLEGACREKTMRLSRLRAQCVECQRKPWVKPWCRNTP